LNSYTRREFHKEALMALAAAPLFSTPRRVAPAAPASCPQSQPATSALHLPPAELAFLRNLTRDVIAAASVKPGEGRGGYRGLPNTCGFTLITPGRGTYPALWVRDFAMALESGLSAADDALAHLRLIARCQNGSKTRKLTGGAIIPPYAIPDHINYDGSAVFYPGTYSPGEDQGGGDYGVLPPVDDHYEFVHIAWHIWRLTGKTDFLREKLGDLTLVERLVAAFNAPEIEADTGLVATSAERRAVGFGFCDGIVHTGELLFASLLRFRAAGELAEMQAVLGNAGAAADYHALRKQIAANLSVFHDHQKASGWLLAATQTSRQPDVWGTLFALHVGVLQGAQEANAQKAVVAAVRNGTICFEGGVRHVPTDRDHSPQSAWEQTVGEAVNTYQNGAYWHTPTGWLLAALARADQTLARRIFDDYLAHLKREDYRRGAGHNAPWECFGPGGKGNQNPVYLASVALPYGILRRST
jgi:hypothetical protein